jgi:peptidoglycan/xylan/chitin deacetylase (PgdA/CDA1 family)
MSEEQERAHIVESRDAVRAVTGEAPLGWCSQDFNQSDRTTTLLAEAGFAYTADWASDDRPFLLGRALVALPPQPEWNDLECMWLRRVPPAVWADNVACAFGFLHDEGGASFNLTLHPWIAGQAHRIRWLREALARVLGRRATWRTTTDEVARWARDQL